MPPATILFVCTGNICRSPLAEAFARQVLSSHFRMPDLALSGLQVASAGTHGLTGHPATEEMQVVGAELGLDLSSHRAARVDERLLEDTSLIYAMETDHLAWLRTTYPGRPAALLAPAGIDDPYGSSLAEYRRAAREIVEGVQLHIPEMVALAG